MLTQSIYNMNRRGDKTKGRLATLFNAD